MIKIKNWSTYQSYKDRKPPWIRFHRSMLDNYSFQSMTSDSRAMLPMLWLLACEHKDPTSGLIQEEVKVLSFRLRLDKKTIAKCLSELQDADFIECIESVTKPLQDSNEVVTPETEAETEAETEKRQNNVGSVFDFWKTSLNHPRSVMDDKRKKLITTALKNYSVEDLKLAITGCSKTPHNMGKNDNSQIYDGLHIILKDSDNIERFMGNAGLSLKRDNEPHRKPLSIGEA